MEKTLSVPDVFIELAKTENVRADIAVEYYLRRIRGRSYYDLCLAISGDFGSDSKATGALNKLWRNWKSYNLSNTITVDKKKFVVDSLPSSANVKAQPFTADSFLDFARSGLERLIGPINEISGPVTKRKPGQPTTDVAGDFHAPFHDPKSLQALMETDSDELILMGDIVDMLSATGHRQTCDYVTCQEELSVGRAILETLAKKYYRIRIVKGNHESRAIKRFQSVLPGLMPLVMNPLDWLAQGIGNIEFLSFDVTDTKPELQFGKDYNLDFLGMHNNCVFGHFEGFCGEDAPKKVDAWLSQWKHVLKHNEPKAVFQGHTHRLSTEFTSSGKLLIATGCMSKPQEYQFLQHGKYSPPVQGFVKLYRNEDTNEFELNKTQLIYTGAW